MLLNTRQQLYKKYLLEGYSKYTSARKAGYSHNTAIQAKNIEKYIKNMDYWLEREGLTDIALANHAKDGMNAMRVISANIYPDEKKADGRTIDFIDVPDWSARHKYFNTILHLREKISDKPLIDQSVHRHLTKVEIKISDETNIPLAQEARNNNSR